MAIQYNPLPISKTAVRYKSPIGNLGSNATGFVFAFTGAGTGSGVTSALASQLDRVYSVQMGLSRWVDASTLQNPNTTDIAVTSAADAFSFTDYVGGHGERSWPIDYGYFFCQGIPHFNSADLLSTDLKTLGGVYIDDNNFDALYYLNGQLVFQRKVAGVSASATLTVALFRDVPFLFGCRWVGANGELGLTPYLLSVFGNGARGTDAVAPGAHLLTPASQVMGVPTGGSGGVFGVNQADMDISQVETGHQVLWDAEIAGMP